jgi:hypothetical protein
MACGDKAVKNKIFPYLLVSHSINIFIIYLFSNCSIYSSLPDSNQNKHFRRM